MDYEKLNSFIHESGFKKNKIAKDIGLTPYGLSQKLTGKTEFKVSEIIKISHILKLNKKERDSIFFNPMLAKRQQIEIKKKGSD